MIRQFAFATLLYSLYLPAYAANIEEGKALSGQCSVCHGKNGISRDPETPNLAGQPARYLEKQLVDFQKGARQDRRMSLIVQSLDIEKIKNLAAYYSSFGISVIEPEN